MALYSDHPRSGKSTVAEMLERPFGFNRVSFAAPIHAMAEVLLRSLGLGQTQIKTYLRTDQKDTATIPELGITGRDLLLAIGAGVRERIPDFWIRVWHSAAMAFAADVEYSLPYIVTDDLRYPNEWAHLDTHPKLDTVFVKVVRPGKTLTNDAEGLLAAHEPDVTIVNDGTLGDLRAQVGNLVAALNFSRRG